VPSSCGMSCELLVSSEQHYHSTTVPPPRAMRGSDTARRSRWHALST
jgi:hypothetical protein